jgi:hypothetical protein
VSGVWQQDEAALGNSTCGEFITLVLQTTIDTGGYNCDYEIMQQNSAITAMESCGSESLEFTGSVDDAGELQISGTDSNPIGINDCTLSITDVITVDASVSPTSASHALTVVLTGDCGDLTDCTAAVTARWMRLLSPP